MSQALWIEYRTEDSVNTHKISITDCMLIKDLIEKIRKTSEFNVSKDFPITLHEPSGTMISVDNCPSCFISGNSQDAPIRIQVSIPSPVVMEQATDSTLTSFWNSLQELSADGDFLHFSVIPEFFPEGMKALYIRKAYKDLFMIIYKHVYLKTIGQRLNKIAIAGTPGIGKKRFFVLYFMEIGQRRNQ